MATQTGDANVNTCTSDIDADTDTSMIGNIDTDAEIDQSQSILRASSQPAFQTRRKYTRRVQNKRGGSPLEQSTALKRVSAEQNPSLSRSKNIPFYEMVLSTFREPKFVESITPVLHSMMAPVVEKAVSKAVETSIEQLRATVIADLINANKSLQETVEKQMELIQSQKSLIDKQTSIIEEKCTKITNLETKVTTLESKFDKMATELNNLEQYGRRNSVRVSNFAYSSSVTESELTESMVKFLNDKVLPSDSKIATSDIERCHPVGHPNARGGRQVLVKFKSYASKHMVFKNKKNLKGNANASFISEDLTRHNHSIVKSLGLHKRDHRIHSYWTYNGQVYAKKSADESPIRITNESDIY